MIDVAGEYSIICLLALGESTGMFEAKTIL
jgi:hypothetical protein